MAYEDPVASSVQGGWDARKAMHLLLPLYGKHLIRLTTHNPGAVLAMLHSGTAVLAPWPPG
jgi:hypothetical protein